MDVLTFKFVKAEPGYALYSCDACGETLDSKEIQSHAVKHEAKAIDLHGAKN